MIKTKIINNVDEHYINKFLYDIKESDIIEIKFIAIRHRSGADIFKCIIVYKQGE